MRIVRDRSEALIMAGFVIVGLAAYARILGTFFVADDFSYLGAIRTIGSPSVIFTPLAGRYFRPAVVFVYYVNYQLAGLSAFSYHLSVVAMHIVNAWLLFRLGRILAPEATTLVPALAGLLFLVFGGHAEAVTWIGGMADPLLTLWLLTGLLLFHRSLESERPLPWWLATWAVFAAALLTKESSAVFLPLAALVMLFGQRGWPSSQRLWRAIAAVSIPVLMLGGYFLLRKAILGFGLVNLEGMGTSTNVTTMARAFLIRSFFPDGRVVIQIWNRSLDLYILLPIAALLFVIGRREDRRPLALLALCLAAAIAPVLPLSIGIGTPESERFIYLPSVFACLFFVWLIGASLRRPAVVVVVTLVFGLYHVRALDRNNKAWAAAARLTYGISTTFADALNGRWHAGEAVYVLNAPDNVRGAFVWRRGLHEALALMSPAVKDAVPRTHVLTVHTVVDETAPITVQERSPSAYALRLGSGSLVGGPSETPFWKLDEWSASGFTAQFKPAAGQGLVVYFTPERTVAAGTLAMTPVPFGVVDLPTGNVDCSAQDPQIVGWALDSTGIDRVAIALENDRDDTPTELGVAQRVPRPDVAAVYPGYPDSQAAGWMFTVPCTAIKKGTGADAVRVRVVARNRQGTTAILGTKAVSVAAR
jgi:protein O-mannosyl-transferase